MNFSFEAAAAMAWDGSPTPARVPQPVCCAVKKNSRPDGRDMDANLVQGQERVDFHDGEVVAEQDERRHVDDILWSSPQVRE